MATHDYSLANASGSSFRTDLNNCLSAIVSQNSSATEPATTFAYMYWIDTSTTPDTVKQRNSTNDGWVVVRNIDGSYDSIGIGTTAQADGSIEIRNTADDALAVVRSTNSGGAAHLRLIANSTGYSRVVFGDNTNQDVGIVAYDHNTNSLGFSTANSAALDSATSQLSIDSSGKVVISGAVELDSTVRILGPLTVDPSNTYAGNNSLIKVGDISNATTTEHSIACKGILQANASYSTTTSSAANAHLNSDGKLIRSTSSRKYKTNIETLEDSYADAILNARPVWFNSAASADTENPNWGYWGFIAEEIADIDPRLVFYGKDSDGNLDPESVQYDRFVPHLVNLVKRQKDQIADLTARLEALEAAS